MGAALSGLFPENNNQNGAPASESTGLGDLPESCLGLILSHLDPPEICNLAHLNRAFHRASSADFLWEPKLPENHHILLHKLFPGDRCSSPHHAVAKKDIYATLCCPIRFSRGTKEVWMEKKGGGICVEVSWKGMKITGINDRRYWNHITTHESRFQTIAYLQQIWWLEVDGELEFELPAGNYSLFFRLQLGGQYSKRLSKRNTPSSLEHVHGWETKPVRFQLSTSNGQYATAQFYLITEPAQWLYYNVGDFVVENSKTPTKIKFSMMQIDCTHTKGGLSLDSVFICPTEIGHRLKQP